MKKYNFKVKVKSIKEYRSGILHIVLQSDAGIPPMNPGQFVEVHIDKAPVLLNRPISIFNRTETELELLVNPIGTGTKALREYKPGEIIGIIGPLGNGFKTDFDINSKVLLVGGGIGVAPLYFLAKTLAEKGINTEIIFGYRTTPDSEICDVFKKVAPLHVCTDDGTAGFHGLVTAHPVFKEKHDFIQVCGPKPMMKACAKLARQLETEAEVSLENHMACGIGACLCCVEDTVDGNVCVCKNGPVFNTKLLKWL